jgi:hypothetical protein
MGRHKPGKPRRERPEPTGHEHDGFEFPAGFKDQDAWTVDYGLLSSLIGAAYDRCTTCQDPLLTLLVEDATTTARLVEIGCIMTHHLLGGLPQSMWDPDVPGTSSREFRRLACAGLDGANEEMLTLCQTMTPTERRSAANTAMDQLIGLLMTGLTP